MDCMEYEQTASEVWRRLNWKIRTMSNDDVVAWLADHAVIDPRRPTQVRAATDMTNRYRVVLERRMTERVRCMLVKDVHGSSGRSGVARA